MSDDMSINAVELATDLTIAWLGNHNTRVSADDVPAFLQTMYETVNALAGGTAEQPGEEPAATVTPAVSVRKSLASPDHIISMIDGRPYRTLRQHLTANGLTPDAYRARYNLKPDYPMIAKSYSTARRELAKKNGLGRKPRTTSDDAAPASGATPAPAADAKPRRGSTRKTKVEA